MSSQFRQFGKTGQLDECAWKVKGVAGFKTSHSRAGCHLPDAAPPAQPSQNPGCCAGWAGGCWINDKWYLARECEA